MKNFLYAVRPLVYDSLGIIVFAVLVMLDTDVLVAAVAGLVIAAAIVFLDLARRRPVPALQWISLLLMLVSTVATYLTNDPRFVMAKPSVVYLIVGCVMLKPGWMNRYVPEDSLPLIGDRMTLFGFVWAGLMFASAALNIGLALSLDAKTWAALMSGWGLFSKIGLFLIQYATMTAIGRRRAAAATGAAIPAS